MQITLLNRDTHHGNKNLQIDKKKISFLFPFMFENYANATLYNCIILHTLDPFFPNGSACNLLFCLLYSYDDDVM